MDWKIKSISCTICKGKCICKPLAPDDIYDILDMVGDSRGPGTYQIYIRQKVEHDYED